jgi:TolA-binding protein
MTDTLNPSDDNLPPSTPLGDTGLEALRKEREERKKLEQQLKDLKGKAEAGDILASEIQEYKTKLQIKEEEHTQSLDQLRGEKLALEKIITSSKIESEFLKTAGEIQLNSKFQGLLLNAHKHEFTVVDGVVKTVDGKTVKEWLENQRSQYPELFDAPKTSGSGIGGSRSNPSGGRRTVIDSSNNQQFLNNLDGIIDGSVSVER